MKNIKSLIIVALLGTSFTSCNDFLTLDPLNDIVLENFWTNKSDVESVLLGAYSALESSDCLLRMSVWGEMRSDNIVEGTNTGEDIQQICRENLLITNSYCKYNKFYDVINRANTVLHFAPIVADKDPNFVYDDLVAQEAEAITLRCLCYWYLIRTFHDVPYVTEPSIDDEGGYRKFFVPQSSFEVILDSLIGDLERVVLDAPKLYPTDDANTGRITRATIYAMLADMYLWRGTDDDLDKCIAVCEEVHKLKMTQYQKLKEKEGKDCTVALFNGYPLIQDAPDDYPGNSYNEIFGTGNSFESLFELPYSNDVKNSLVGTYYLSDQLDRNRSVGQLKAFEDIGKDFSSSTPNKVFEQQQDTRYYQNIRVREPSYAIAKYAYSSIDLIIDGNAVKSTGTSWGSLRGQNSSQPNWIVYRYTEVLLFEAEAYILKAMKISPEGQDSLAQVAILKEYKDKAFDLIDAVNKRSIVADNDKLENPRTLKQLINYTAQTSAQDLETTLFKERRREFLFEGKRWYDLVRIARRDGNQNRLLNFVEKKYQASTLSAVRIKLKNPYAMYFPLAKDEVRNSQGVLKQNPAYSDEEKIEQAH